MKFFLLLFISCLSLFAVQANAQVTNTLVREARSMAMGGSGVALADDEFALFHNVAGLAGQNNRRFKLIGLTAEGSQDAYTEISTSLDTFKNFKFSTLNQLMGKDIALRASMVPIIQLPNFAITYLYDAQGSLNEFNLANPTFTLGDMITHGVQAGMAWDLIQGKRTTEDMRIGVAAKVLWRKGGFYDISTAGFLQASSDSKKYLDSLLGNYGMGFGADLGFQYVNHVDKVTKLFFGSSVTDIANTSFSDPHAASIPMNISVGVGAEKRIEVGKVKVDFDLRNLSQTTSLANKTHLGAELSIPVFDFDIGLNQLNFTYGIAFDVWVLRVQAMSYAEEYGIAFHQDTSRKYLVQVDLNLPI